MVNLNKNDANDAHQNNPNNIDDNNKHFNINSDNDIYDDPTPTHENHEMKDVGQIDQFKTYQPHKLSYNI